MNDPHDLEDTFKDLIKDHEARGRETPEGRRQLISASSGLRKLGEEGERLVKPVQKSVRALQRPAV